MVYGIYYVKQCPPNYHIFMTEEVKKIFGATEVGVLIEDFEGQVKVVAEGVLSLDQKLDRVSAEFDKKLDVVAEGVLTLDRKVGALPERMDRIEDKLDKIDAKIALINEEIVEIKAMLSGKADLSRLEDLEERIARLEAEQKELRSRIGVAS